ncbi:MAG: hypothetical protein Q8J65_10305, partial [Nitrosomonadales bacterium]|nr:hypothetical protein [Nitrosomonadales bacterium]
MAFKFSARTWHNWVSFVLVIPILIVSITAVLIAHDKRLGLKEIDITRLVGWLPGYGTSAMKQEKMEIRATLSEEDGSRWVGTKMGLYKYEQEKLLPIPELSGIEVRDLLAAPWGVIAATKNGVWLLQNNQWQNVYKGDVWNASLTGENVMVSIKDRGLIYSNNGINWKPEQETQQALMNVPMQEMG